MAKIAVLNGPNLNLLGSREPDVYGRQTLAAVVDALREQAQGLGHTLLDYQSNSEGQLVDFVHRCPRENVAALIVNPGAYTHTSIALRDALLGVGLPFFEVHLSNTYAREPFRHRSYFSDIAAGVLVGMGVKGYELALLAAHARMAE